MAKPKPALPHTEQCEKGLLCSFILNPPWVADLCKFRNAEPDWFYDPDREKLFTALMEMKGLEKAPAGENMIPVGQYCEENQKRLNFSSDITTLLLDIATFVGTASNAVYYLDKLQEYAAKRRAILGAKNSVLAIEQSTSLQEIFDVTSKVFVPAHEICVVSEKVDHDKEDYTAFLDEMEGLATGSKKPDLMPTYIPALDEEVGGMARGELYVVHGLTSSGKSLLGQQILQDNVLLGGRKGMIFTMEMPYNQYMRRMVARHGSVSLSSMREGRFTKHELESFSNSMSKMSDWACSIQSPKRNAMTPMSIEGAIRRHKKNHGCDIVLIDYLQLMKFSPSEKRRDQELQSFSTTIKQMAIELDLVMVLIAQANDKGIVFDSSQVESDSDGVLSMVPEYGIVAGQKKVIGTKGVFIQKFREGRRGWTVKARMEGKFARLAYD